MPLPSRLESLQPISCQFRRHRLLAAAACWLMAPGMVSMAADSTQNLAEREIQRRIDLVSRSGEQLLEADKMLNEAKLVEALAIYQSVYADLPDVAMARAVKAAALQGYTTTACAQAQVLMSQGRREDALKLLDEITAPGVDPGNAEARRLRGLFADPDRFPRALTPDHIDKVAQVKKLLLKAASYHELGDYDRARETFLEVLRLDPYNTAARRGMEAAEADRGRYFDAARDQRRSSMFNDVNAAWEEQVPIKDVSAAFGTPGTATILGKGGRDAIVDKLRKLVLAKIDFSGAALEEVVEFLRVRTRDLDPAGKGIDFVLNVPPEVRSRSISVNLSSMPVEEVLRYVCEMSGATYKVDDFAVRIASLSEDLDTLINKSWRVPPDFISSAPVTSATAPADPFAATTAPATGTGLVLRKMGAKEFLESRGVTFPEGAGASYNPATNFLAVRNTPRNIEIVEMLVEDSARSSPKQAVISVRIMEVTQDNLKELGFDWLLGAIGRGNAVQGGGGGLGNSSAGNLNAVDFPANLTVPNPAPPPAPATIVNPLLSPISRGIRSGNNAIPASSIDRLLVGATLAAINPAAASTVAPGILSVAGVLTDPQFGGVMRGLDQKKGVDLMTAPSATTRSGQAVRIELVRDFPYPTEFDPPQVPQGGGATIVTPTTPTAFEVRKVGTTLDVEPVIAEDARSIELTLTPEHVEFEGFINYGTPISGPTGVVLTANQILQPVFKSRKVSTSVKVWDGATVVLGGMKTEEVIGTDDQIPGVGSLPVIGRLAQGRATKRVSRNIIFFVTVQVIDPSGKRVNQPGTLLAQP